MDVRGNRNGRGGNCVLGENKRTQMGQVLALIHDIKTVEPVMRELVDGGLAAAQASSKALSGLAGEPEGRPAS